MNRLGLLLSYLLQLLVLLPHAYRLARMRLETHQELYSELQYFQLQPAVLRERIRQVVSLEQTLAQGLAAAQTQRARQTVLRAFQAGLKRLDEDIDHAAPGDPLSAKAA